MQRFQSVKRTAVRFATVLLIASLALFTGCTSEGSNQGVGFGQNPGIGDLPGTVTQLAFLNAPPQPLVAGQPFTLQVATLDAQGNLVTNEPTRVMLALTQVAPRGSLFGTRIADTVDGVATFDGLFIDEEAVYTIRATAVDKPGVEAAVLAQFAIGQNVPALINTLVFEDTVGSFLQLPLTLDLFDAFGNPATDFMGTVTATILSGPTNGRILNPTVGVINGVANFTNLFFTDAGDYTIRVAVDGLPNAVAQVYNVTVTPSFLALQGTQLSAMDITTNPATSNFILDLGAGTYAGLASLNDGRLVTVNTLTAQLVEIDLDNGGTIVIGGTMAGGNFSDLGYDPVTDTLFGLNGAMLYIFDQATGAANLQGMLAGDALPGVDNNALAALDGDLYAVLNPPQIPPMMMGEDPTADPSQFGRLFGINFFEDATFQNGVQLLTDTMAGGFLGYAVNRVDPGEIGLVPITAAGAPGTLVGLQAPIQGLEVR